MAARPIGNATISFGLVSIPVRLYVATDVIGEASLEAYHHAQEWLATDS